MDANGKTSVLVLSIYRDLAEAFVETVSRTLAVQAMAAARSPRSRAASRWEWSGRGPRSERSSWLKTQGVLSPKSGLTRSNGVAGKDGEEPDGRGEAIETPGGDEDHSGKDPQIPAGGHPGFAEEVSRPVMVKDIGTGDEFPQDGAVLAEVGVFDPVEDADDEVGGEGGEGEAAQSLEDPEQEGVPKLEIEHGPAVVAGSGRKG